MTMHPYRTAATILPPPPSAPPKALDVVRVVEQPRLVGQILAIVDGDALVSFSRRDAAGGVGPHGGAPISAVGRSSTVCWVFHLHEIERVGR